MKKIMCYLLILIVFAGCNNYPRELDEHINTSLDIKMEKVKVTNKDSLIATPHYQIIMKKVSLKKAKTLYPKISDFPLSKNLNDDDYVWLGKSPVAGTYRNHLHLGGDPLVKVGDNVKEDDILCYIEDEKFPLCHDIRASGSGTIIGICKREGEQVKLNELLFVFKDK